MEKTKFQAKLDGRMPKLAQVVQVPKRLDTNGVLQFVRTMNALPDDDEYSFEFSDHRWAEPFGILYALAAIRLLQESRPDSKISAQNYKQHGYHGHMGFFQACGFEYGNKPGDAPGSHNYLPITEIDISEVYQEAAASGLEVGELIDRDANRIAEVLTRDSSGNLYEVVQYALREILRNALEHSQAERVFYCGQYLPADNRVQIAIHDAGIGIHQSLSNNPHLQIDNDADALKLAILPGISGKMYPGIEARPYDAWQNSGYGLYMIHRICRQAGSFLITAERGTLSVLRDRHDSADDYLLPGTGILLLLDTRRLGELSEQLAQFSKEGQEIAQKLGGAQPLKASAASLMLHRQEGN